MRWTFRLTGEGRSKCRGGARPIQRGELRSGERLLNPFAEGAMKLWFYKRPEPLFLALRETPENVPDRDRLERAGRAAWHIDASRGSTAPSGQAKCRSCRQPIVRGTWRIRAVFYEEGRFSPEGFVHLNCRKAYFETNTS